MTSKCVFGYIDEKNDYMCSYDNKCCEDPRLTCHVLTIFRDAYQEALEQTKQEYEDQLNWDYRAHEDIRE